MWVRVIRVNISVHNKFNDVPNEIAINGKVDGQTRVSAPVGGGVV